MEIAVKRAYEEPSAKDGQRILVDRIWPRGRSKEELQLDAWVKEIAPSNELRKWFGHEEEKWPEFKRRYFAELDSHPEAVAELRNRLGTGRVTLVFGARDEAHNNAVALKEYLEQG